MKGVPQIPSDSFQFEQKTDSLVIPFQDQKKPLFSFGGRKRTNNWDIDNPIGLSIHPISGLILIAENTLALNASPAIHVFTPQGNYVTSFGIGYIVSPCKISIAIEPHAIYILAQLRQALTQFTDFTIKILCPIDSSLPRGLVCDDDGFIYVIDAYKRRICVYSSDLQLERDFYLDIVVFPINLELLTDILVILCNPPAILYYSIQGEKLRFIPDISDYVIRPMNFCVDQETNWTYISDGSNNCIQIFNMEGELIRTISSKLLRKRTRAFFPSFLAITPQHTPMVANSRSETNPIQIFSL